MPQDDDGDRNRYVEDMMEMVMVMGMEMVMEIVFIRAASHFQFPLLKGLLSLRLFL